MKFVISRNGDSSVQLIHVWESDKVFEQACHLKRLSPQLWQQRQEIRRELLSQGDLGNDLIGLQQLLGQMVDGVSIHWTH